MADTATVCSMCGDVGFPEKLFRCTRCRHRFQHSYCTNYYGDGAPASAGFDVCDWCLSDVVAGKARWSSSGTKHQHASGGSQESSSTTSSGSGRGKASGGDPLETGRRSTRPPTRRYKLLKDVLC
ncbi:hypothetical protein PR202_ga19457 [Eleusine coracana subsp. coracana]|uniref:PHD-type zinc finger plants domain-containing protein n=1 Tax=Eleusine coracana subsp. coracana TaxID=191504 RepID=A0AAV5CVL6_ELECO|nr:hypothetical protein QOZ80_4AG0308230 [Eleusine coracana subsp. coracana]GJN02134.1 hypothetical protein PR202_ga19457 [Eleusine coracana subsp. coracana]